MPKARTSKSHPLQIAEVEVPGCDGLIGITFCPGKKDPYAQTGAWDRDIPTDVDRIKQWGANVVLSLLENHEFDQLNVIGLRDEVVGNGMGWIQLPIKDQAVPDGLFESRWEELGPLIRSNVCSGGKVLIHCKGGLGRSGTVVARLLVEFGEDSDTAINKVRDARPKAIENTAQEDYVKSCKPMP